MSDRIKRILAIAFCAMNPLLGSAMVLGGLLTFDEDTLAIVLFGAAFLLNAVLMYMYSRTLSADIRMKEILDEEEKRMEYLRRQDFRPSPSYQEEEDDLEDLLSRKSSQSVYERRRQQ